MSPTLFSLLVQASGYTVLISAVSIAIGLALALVVVSHEIGFAASVGEQIAFLDHGQILLRGTQAVFGKPRHPRLDQFLDTYIDRGAAMLV